MRNIGISLLAAFALALPATAKSASKDDAQVTCSDGTTSKAGRGACSHHGGVASEQLAVGSRHPSGRIDQAFAVRIIARPFDEHPHGCFGVGLGRFRHPFLQSCSPIPAVGRGHRKAKWTPRGGAT